MYIGSYLRIESWMFEIVLYLLFILVFWAGTKIIGREKTSLFLWGSLIWTLTVENAMVMIGAYDYFAYANYYCWAGTSIPGFSGWSCMVFLVPLSISIGWFIFGLSAFIISDRLLPRGNIWIKAVVASVMMVSLDMLMDPISVVNEWWRWTVAGFYFRGVSVGNYIGWFFMLFFFAGIYERSVIERGSFAWLRPIERLIFRRDTKDLADADSQTLKKIFYFRTVVFIPVMLFVTILASQPLKHIGFNRYAPFNSVFPTTYDQKYPESAKPAGLAPAVIPDGDPRKVKGPRCEIGRGTTVPVHPAGGASHVQK